MNNLLKSKKVIITSIVILFSICFISANLIISLTTNKINFDVTDNKKYTLNNQSVKLLKNLNNNIKIDLYLSSDFVKYFPTSKNYLTYVGNILEKYSKISNRKITINIKDPKPFSAIEKEALANKIAPVSNSHNSYSSYFGAVFTNSYGKKEIIEYFPSYRMGYLEKDISNVINRLSKNKKKNIAIFADNISVLGNNKNISTFTKSKNLPKWSFIKSLEKDYNIYTINDYEVELSDEFSALIILNPKKLSKTLLYSIDQYILRGGSVLFFVDPYSESENEQKGYNAIGKPKITEFLANYGIKYYDGMVISDQVLAANKTISNINKDQKTIKYPAWLDVNFDHINNGSLLTKNFDKLKFATSGALAPIVKKDVVITNLAKSSNQAKLIRDTQILQNTNLYGKNIKPEQYSLAIYSRGKFNSLFETRPEFTHKYKNFHLNKSYKNGRIIVIADSDMINDKFFTNSDVETNENKSIYELNIINNNLDFVENSIKILTDDIELLDLSDKINTSQKNSIFIKINDIYKQKYIPNKRELLSKIERDKEKYINLSQEYKTKTDNIEILKELSSLTKDMNNNLVELEKIDYLIKQEVNQRLQIIMLLNIIIFPILLTILIYLLKLLSEKIKARKVKNDYQ